MTNETSEFAFPEGVDGVDVEWAEARAANQRNWDERVAVHLQGYGIDELRASPTALSDVVAYDLPRA